MWYFNPRTPCGVRRDTSEGYMLIDLISIHAPLAGCDMKQYGLEQCRQNFNPRTPCGVRPITRPTFGIVSISIHAPLAGCDESSLTLDVFWKIFQSTHPLRGATGHALVRCTDDAISIHAPLAGCDMRCAPGAACTPVFQSMHPLRGATTDVCAFMYTVIISIHAPLAGCDTIWNISHIMSM